MKVYFIFLSICISLLASSQENKEMNNSVVISRAKLDEGKELLRKSDDYFFVGNFNKALPLLREAIDFFPKDALLNFKIGVCLIKTGKEKESLPFFLKSKELNSKVDPKVDYAIGMAYQSNKEYNQAIDAYYGYLESLSGNRLSLEKVTVDAQILECKAQLLKLQKAETLVSTPKIENVEKKRFKSSENYNETIYKIQIASASRPLAYKDLKSIYSGSLKISRQKIGTAYKYFLGSFLSKREADKARLLSGVKGAFLVRFRNGKKL